MKQDAVKSSNLNEDGVVMIDAVFTVPAPEGDDRTSRVNRDELEGLTSEQLAGFHEFYNWFYSSENLSGVLDGRGGTGKTYAIAAWIKAADIPQGAVKVLAPSNSAVKTIKDALESHGVCCECSTIDSALGYAPRQVKWGRDERLELAELEQKRDAADPFDDAIQIRDTLDPRIRQLYSYQNAVKNNEPIFAPGPNSPTPEDVDHYELVIVDECSMVRTELFDALLTTFKKIFFMGDKEQLFPIKEGLSKTFSCPQIATFDNVMRSAGDLKVLNAALRAPDLRTVYSVARGVARLEGQLAYHSAATLDRRTARDLVHTWVKDRPWDGKEFRILCYKNETIENTLVHVKNYVGEDWKEGDLILANKPLTRWAGGEVGTETALITNAESEIVEVCNEWVSPIHTIGGTHNIRVKEVLVEAPEFNLVSYMQTNPESHVKKEWVDRRHLGLPKGICTANLVSFQDFKIYRDALKTWKLARGAMYSKSKPLPKDTDAAKTMLALLGLESWTQIPGAPGYKRFNCEDAREHKGLDFLQLDVIRPPKTKGKYYRDGSPIDFDWLLKGVNQYFYWLSELNDPLRLRICSTVHKAQGMSIDDVMIHLPELYESRNYGRDAQDNAKRAIYTAASRASKRLYIIV